MTRPDIISKTYHFILLPPEYLITCIIEKKKTKNVSTAFVLSSYDPRKLILLLKTLGAKKLGAIPGLFITLAPIFLTELWQFFLFFHCTS